MAVSVDTEEPDVGVTASANGKARELWSVSGERDDACHVSRKSWHKETRMNRREVSLWFQM